MENWKFLIQQEGDREWLPLDLPESEILEGRYRLVGQSQRGPHPVQISLVYRDLDTGARPRHYRRTGQTNAEGLVGVFPFTRLHPGLWEITCGLDEGAVALHLQVVPHDGGSELESDLDLSALSPFRGGDIGTAPRPAAVGTADPAPDQQLTQQLTQRPELQPDPQPDPQPNPAASPTAAQMPDEALASVTELFQTVEELADQVIGAMAERMTEDNALEAAAAALMAEAPPPEAAPSPTETPAPATIHLESCAYTLYRGRPFTVKGTLSGASESGLPAPLQLTLIEPQTGKAIASYTSPKAIARLPQTFHWDVAVSPPPTQLLLARLALRSETAPTPWPLAECSFAVMVLSEPDEPAPPAAPAAPPGAAQVELPPFLQGKTAVPPEAKAAALAKIAELESRQDQPHQEGPALAAPNLEQPKAGSPGDASGDGAAPSVEAFPKAELEDGSPRSGDLENDSPQADELEDSVNPFQYPSL